MKWKTGATVGVIAVALCSAAWALQGDESAPSNDDPSYWKDFQGAKIRNTLYWQKRIRESGRDAAYAELREQVQPYNDYGRHLTAHQFGNALYAVDGLEGVAVCNHEFGQGCFHQFFMSALADKGESVVSDFTKACADKLGKGESVHACNHGMGHGVMIAFEDRGIEGALTACATIEDSYAFHGCIDGVYMEYFTPTHLGREDAELPRREFDAERPFGPCPALEPEFQPTCYYMQASWWGKIKGFSEAGVLCARTPAHRAACFKGLGHSITFYTLYDKAETIVICDKITDAQDDFLACRAGAHWAFAHGAEVGENLTADDMMICNYADAALTARCLKEADLRGSSIGISAICCPDDKRFRDTAPAKH